MTAKFFQDSFPKSMEEIRQMEPRQRVQNAKRVVVKAGSSTVTEDGEIAEERVDALVKDLATLSHAGKEVIVVTSGAVALGRNRVEPQSRAAAAAVGVSGPIHAYEARFRQYARNTATLLLTSEDLIHPDRRANLERTLNHLLTNGVVPILNENDPVAVESNGIGDNDTLAANVTEIAQADLLIILSDQDGFYTADPRKNPNAELIQVIQGITDAHKHAAGGAGRAVGTGGMATKLRAAERVTRKGTKMVLANGSHRRVVSRILAGEALGTLFLPEHSLPALAPAVPAWFPTISRLVSAEFANPA
jgi:glutamate 5-kinase